MVKGCKALVSSIVEEKRGTFETNRECAIRAYRVYGTTVQHRLYEDDKKERYFHIYYNPAKQAAEREQFEQKVEKFQQFLESRRNTADKFGKTYQHYFHLHYDKKGTFLGADERRDVVV